MSENYLFQNEKGPFLKKKSISALVKRYKIQRKLVSVGN